MEARPQEDGVLARSPIGVFRGLGFWGLRLRGLRFRDLGFKGFRALGVSGYRV